MKYVAECLLLAALSVGQDARAQAANEFDFDPGMLAVIPVMPNGPTHTITNLVAFAGQNLTLAAPLLVTAGAELRLVRSTLKVTGNVTMAELSRITLIDSSLLLQNTSQGQYELRNEGGLLHTERSTIGGGYDGANLYLTRFLHFRGTWLARQTVVQGMGTVLADGRIGWFGDPRFRGGSIFADGLYEGDRTGQIFMSGMGDAQLRNGTMGVGFYFDAAASPLPAAATLNLDSRSPQNVVYGDPSAHQGVTSPFTREPFRLELQNHRVPIWSFSAVNAVSSGPLQTLTLQNAEEVICNLTGHDLVGRPVLGGPWASHYAVLPGLPSTTRPGWHAMPPGCSVQLGNVRFQSGPGPNDWNRIQSWGIYASGTGTNLTVTGPSTIAELILTDGRAQFAGTGSYDMRVFADVVRLYATASLQITNASLGEFGLYPGTVGLIEANGSSSVTITNSRASDLRLRTTSPAASITASDILGVSRVIQENQAGTLHVMQATPLQNTDLQNLGFESPLLVGNVPPYWATASATGSLAPDPAPGAPGAVSYNFIAQAANASLQKQLTLPPETFVTVVGAAKILQHPLGGSQLLLQASNGASTASRALDTSILNTWRRVHVPLLTVGNGGPTLVRFMAGGLPTSLRLDDVRVQISSWWENDNLGNLDFEGECRWQGQKPGYWSSPDAWYSFQARCAPAPGIVRPGSTGTRSVQLTLESSFGSISKDLKFLRPLDTVVVRGWCRGLDANPSANMQAIIGDGPTYYVVGAPNQHSGPMPCDGTWRKFQLIYSVPATPSFYTRIDLSLFDVAGTQCWFDDVTVDIQ